MPAVIIIITTMIGLISYHLGLKNGYRDGYHDGYWAEPGIDNDGESATGNH